MKRRQSVFSDAEENVSRWESLLNDIKGLFSEADRLEGDIDRTSEEIDDAWDDTSGEISRVDREVERSVAGQVSDRQADSEFDRSGAADPPEAVPDVDPVHGDPDLPSDADYEIPEPITEAEIRGELDGIEESEPVTRERATPFTELEWFELHSAQYPIGEELFAPDPARHLADETDAEGDARVAERDAERGRDRDTGREEES
ncbi:hypothetical protein EXE46_07725 [Halorubrum sp. GN11_10-6_MGM]|uniref:hypothetical protein n=1 Tax=Halorubrum sp. GN11_10-6_MGM TaxID=2518112 RepID=UPI0010FA33F6|nr:hypothetical protein [Halorubrum sp. GN11_10-6_MGM]TKX74745.1 hypothetical protein EXE46_07725 [Halorubrum sp. GN11_10-6_MGM]